VRRVRFAIAAALVSLLPLLPTATARADGDPCSDFLLVQSLCVPLNRPSQAHIDQLQKTIDAARKNGYEVRVAVIASPQDLGAVPQFFGRPQPYATFLDAELQGGYRGRLLVVMAAGYGVRSHAKADKQMQQAIKGLAPPSDPTPNGLMTAGVTAVRTLAQDAGVQVPAIPLEQTGQPSGSGSGGTSVSTTTFVVVLVVGVLALGGIVAAILLWPGRGDDEDDEEQLDPN
jgi:hypothetical protein